MFFCVTCWIWGLSSSFEHNYSFFSFFFFFKIHSCLSSFRLHLFMASIFILRGQYDVFTWSLHCLYRFYFLDTCFTSFKQVFPHLYLTSDFWSCTLCLFLYLCKGAEFKFITEYWTNNESCTLFWIISGVLTICWISIQLVKKKLLSIIPCFDT